MKGQLSAATPREYLAQLDEPRRSDLVALDRLIRKHAPKLKPVVQNGMLGYGPFRYHLPRASIGKSCVRFKRLSDLDEKALVKLIQLTAKTRYGENES